MIQEKEGRMGAVAGKFEVGGGRKWKRFTPTGTSGRGVFREVLGGKAFVPRSTEAFGVEERGAVGKSHICK